MENILKSYDLTYAGIAAVIVLMICVVIGYRRGLIREAFSIISIFIAITLTGILNPYVQTFLEEKTPIYQMIENKSEEYINSKVEIPQVAGEEEQLESIEALQLPEFIQEALKKNNSAATYTALGINTFTDYLTEYIAQTVIKALSFAVTYVLIWIILKIIRIILEAVSLLPVVNGVNKLGGALVGAAKYLILLWAAMLLLSIFIDTSWGKGMLDMIYQDKILSSLYKINPIYQWFMSIK